MKTGKKICIMGVLAAVVLVLGACGATKVDMQQYVTVECSGADGHGTLDIQTDYEGLVKNLAKDADKVETLEDLATAMDTSQGLLGMTCSASKTENLKNGDEVTVSLKNFEEAEKALKVSFSNTEFTYTVSGLTPVKDIDPFEGVSVLYEGDISDGYSAKVQYDSQYDGLISYNAEAADGIVSGGTVTVTYNYDEDALLEAGYAIKADAPESKDFTIDGIDSYVSGFTTISDEAKEEMKRKGVSLIKSTYFGENGSYNDIKNVLTNRKNLDYGWEDANGKLKSEVEYEHSYFKMNDSKNIVRMMFSFKVKDRRTTATMHAVVQYLDVIQKASGDTYVNYENNWDGNYSIVYLDTSVKDIENELVVNNEYEKAE